MTRCTEAGAYARDFVTAVVATLQASLGGGLVLSPQERKCGGGPENDPQEETEDQFGNFAARVIREASRAHRPAGPEETENQGSASLDGQRATGSGERPVEGRSAEEGRDGRSGAGEGHGENNEAEVGEEIEEEPSQEECESRSQEAEEGEEEEDEDSYTSRSRSRSRGEPDPEAGARDDPTEDYWEVRPAQGCVIRHHVQKRKHLFVPQPEAGVPIVIEQFRHDRRTQVWSSRRSMVVIDDDWLQEGAVNPGYGWWVGTTAFTLKGRELAWGPGGGYGWHGRPSGGPGQGPSATRDEDDETFPTVVARGTVGGTSRSDGRACWRREQWKCPGTFGGGEVVCWTLCRRGGEVRRWQWSMVGAHEAGQSPCGSCWFSQGSCGKLVADPRGEGSGKSFGSGSASLG